MQDRFGSRERAESFYTNQVLDHLNERMRAFVERQEMMFVATADRYGDCDCTLRAGTPGFAFAVDPGTVVYPEYRGNGVYASLANITENANVGLLFVDFCDEGIGLHVNGSAEIVEHPALLADMGADQRVGRAMAGVGSRTPERWVRVRVREAYVHCSKHIPLFAKASQGAAGARRSRPGGDVFGVRAAREREQRAGPALH